jgi:hypothetical protein
MQAVLVPYGTCMFMGPMCLCSNAFIGVVPLLVVYGKHTGPTDVMLWHRHWAVYVIGLQRVKRCLAVTYLFCCPGRFW